MSEYPASPDVWNTPQEAHFFSLIQKTERELGDAGNRTDRTQTLTAPPTPSGSSLTSHLGHLTCGPSNWPIGTPDILYVSLPLHLGWFLKCNFPEITFMSCKARTMNKEQLFPECVLMNGECKYLL